MIDGLLQHIVTDQDPDTATGEGYRESLGFDVVTAEDGAAWLAFLRSLVTRG